MSSNSKVVINLAGVISAELMHLLAMSNCQVVTDLSEVLASDSEIIILTRDEAFQLGEFLEQHPDLKQEISVILLTRPLSINQFFVNGGRGLIDEQMLYSDAIATIVKRAFTHQATLHIESTYENIFETFKGFKITNPFTSGQYSDHISAEASRQGHDLIQVKSYFINAISYIIYLLKDRLATLPIEVEYGSSKNCFAVQISFSSERFIADYIISALSEDRSLNSAKQLLSLAHSCTDFLDIYYLQSVKKIVMTSVWVGISNKPETFFSGFTLNNIDNGGISDTYLKQPLKVVSSLEEIKEDLTQMKIPGGLLDLYLLKKNLPTKYPKIIQALIEYIQKRAKGDPIVKVSGEITRDDLSRFIDDYPNKELIAGLTEGDQMALLKLAQDESVTGFFDLFGPDSVPKLSDKMRNKEGFFDNMLQTINGLGPTVFGELIKVKGANEGDIGGIIRIAGHEKSVYVNPLIRIKGTKIDPDNFKVTIKGTSAPDLSNEMKLPDGPLDNFDFMSLPESFTLSLDGDASEGQTLTKEEFVLPDFPIDLDLPPGFEEKFQDPTLSLIPEEYSTVLNEAQKESVSQYLEKKQAVLKKREEFLTKIAAVEVSAPIPDEDFWTTNGEALANDLKLEVFAIKDGKKSLDDFKESVGKMLQEKHHLPAESASSFLDNLVENSFSLQLSETFEEKLGEVYGQIDSKYGDHFLKETIEKKDAQIKKMKDLIDKMKVQLLTKGAPAVQGSELVLGDKNFETKIASLEKDVAMKEIQLRRALDSSRSLLNEKSEYAKKLEREMKKQKKALFDLQANKGSDENSSALKQENKNLLSIIEVSNRKIAQLSEMLAKTKANTEKRDTFDIDRMKENFDHLKKENDTYRSEMVDLQTKYKNLEEDYRESKRRYKEELLKMVEENDIAPQVESPIVESIKGLEAEKRLKEKDELLKATEKKVKELTQKLKFAEAKGGDLGSGQANKNIDFVSKSGSEVLEHKLKSLEEQNNKLINTAKKALDDLNERKKEVQKYKSEITALQNKLTQLEFKSKRVT